jgi:hypothetical protein
MMFNFQMRNDKARTMTSVSAGPGNATMTACIGQPRSLSARQKQEPRRSLQCFNAFDCNPLFASSYDFSTHSLVKLLPGSASSSHLFDTHPDHIMQAINALKCTTKLHDFRLSKTQDAIDTTLGNELLVSTLDLQADQVLSADVRTANKAAEIAGMWSPNQLLTAGYPAAYPATRCRNIDSGQTCNIVAAMPEYDDTAQSWALQPSSTLNTMMFESTSAITFIRSSLKS